MHQILQTSIIAVTLAITGCGHDDNDQYDFTGTWTGTLSANAATCFDGSSIPANSSQVSFPIIAAKNGLVLSSRECGDLSLTQHGNRATQSHLEICGSTFDPTSPVLIGESIHDTSLILNGNTVQVDLIRDFSIFNKNAFAYCNSVHAIGVLVRAVMPQS